MTNSTVLAVGLADRWHSFWQDPIGVWILDRGVPIALYLIGGLLAARFITWLANRIVRRIDAEYRESDQLVRSESAKHRQAVASVDDLRSAIRKASAKPAPKAKPATKKAAPRAKKAR